MFDKLFQGYLPDNMQLKLLIEICKRGWEYLAFFIGSFIRLLKKYNIIGPEKYAEEL